MPLAALRYWYSATALLWASGSFTGSGQVPGGKTPGRIVDRFTRLVGRFT